MSDDTTPRVAALFHELMMARSPQERARMGAEMFGLATETLAVVKVEELLDIQSAGGWTFAHELAHLALTHAGARLLAEVERQHALTLQTEHVGDAYQRSNVQEFFACAYVDYLRVRHRTTTYVEPDDERLLAALHALFAGLEAW